MLKPGLLYVVTASAPVSVQPGTTGVLKISQKNGPITIFGAFVDSKNGPEDRTYTDPVVYVVQAVGTGASDLIIVRSLTDDTQTMRQTIATDLPAPVPTPPPNPPGPGPAPAPAPDPLASAVQAAYTAETDTAKAVSAPRLAFLYQDIARTVVDDPKTVTVNDLIRSVMTQRKALIGEGLPLVRAAIDKEFQAKLGSATASMDANERTAAKAVLNSAAAALNGAK